MEFGHYSISCVVKRRANEQKSATDWTLIGSDSTSSCESSVARSNIPVRYFARPVQYSRGGAGDWSEFVRVPPQPSLQLAMNFIDFHRSSSARHALPSQSPSPATAAAAAAVTVAVMTSATFDLCLHNIITYMTVVTHLRLSSPAKSRYCFHRFRIRT